MRRLLLSGLIILLVLIVLGQGAFLAIFFLGPRSALDKPSDALSFVTNLGTNLLIPDQDKTRPNPEANNPDAIKNIERVYQSRCQVCHGVDGKGQSATGSRMFPRAGDLTGTRAQTRSDGSIFWIIGNGLPHTGMPGWKGVLKDDEIWQLVEYVRALPKGIPTASPTVPPTIAVSNPTESPTLAASNPTVSPSLAASSPTESPTLIATNPTVPPTFAASSPTGSPTLVATNPIVPPTLAAPSATLPLTPPATSSPIQATNTVTIFIQYYTYFDASYNSDVTVPVGTRVVWLAADDDAHTVSSETTPRALNSPNLLKGETYEYTFTEPGEYRYFCVPHPSMTASVIVK